MKDTLDEKSRQALIKYRMERAYDSMNEAKLLLSFKDKKVIFAKDDKPCQYKKDINHTPWFQKLKIMTRAGEWV